MKLPASAHLTRGWRIHEIAPDYRIEDVWALPTIGTADDFPAVVDLIRTLDFPDSASLAVRLLWGVRDLLGRVGLGRISAPAGSDTEPLGIPGTREATLFDRLPADLRASHCPSTTRSDTPFRPLYVTEHEYAAEISNRTVHSVLHLAWVEQSPGRYGAQMAVLVKPRGLLGRAYMAAIKPFRLALVYPALLRAVERAWTTAPTPSHDDAEREARTRDQGQVRRVRVSDPIATAGPYDYADAFELGLEEPDHSSPEEWVRAGIDATPDWIKRIAGARDGFGSVRIVRSETDVVVLEDSDALMDTMIVGRNVDSHRRMFTTALRYRRPLLARAAWSVVGILHRRTAQRVVAAGLGPSQG